MRSGLLIYLTIPNTCPVIPRKNAAVHFLRIFCTDKAMNSTAEGTGIKKLGSGTSFAFNTYARKHRSLSNGGAMINTVFNPDSSGRHRSSRVGSGYPRLVPDGPLRARSGISSNYLLAGQCQKSLHLTLQLAPI